MEAAADLRLAEAMLDAVLETLREWIGQGRPGAELLECEVNAALVMVLAALQKVASK
jgi:uncharacterized protein (DUF2267 family)